MLQPDETPEEDAGEYLVFPVPLDWNEDEDLIVNIVPPEEGLAVLAEEEE